MKKRLMAILASVTMALSFAMPAFADTPEGDSNNSCKYQGDFFTITGDSQGNQFLNGSPKTYTVTVIHPITKRPIQDEIINVTFLEKINIAPGTQKNIYVIDQANGFVIPYQANDGTQNGVEILTDENGTATFTISGENTAATPIVFFDGSGQEVDPSGNGALRERNERFESEHELCAQADTVSFIQGKVFLRDYKLIDPRYRILQYPTVITGVNQVVKTY
ncbi:hypothetical protein R4Z09_27835 [Niallia oryzisoli]|uniref:Uncharacterized protein n=1 Tax=Niallia oryzisoli TaxID=1737571 RepID=A0ABZ2CB68_9BACI